MSVTSIYPILIAAIQASLDAVDNIKEVFAYPATDITKYPAVIFFPAGIENTFDSVQENFKIYTFKIYVIVNAGQKPLSEIFATVMPDTMDAVLAQLDADWSTGVIDGHTAWSEMDIGAWSVSEEDAGLEVTAELELKVKILTNN